MPVAAARASVSSRLRCRGCSSRACGSVTLTGPVLCQKVRDERFIPLFRESVLSLHVLRQQGPCDHQDPICTAAYLWSVGHTDPRHLEVLEAIIDVFLVLNVQMCRALVQKEYSWLSIECSCEHHSLFSVRLIASYPYPRSDCCKSSASP